MQLSEFIVWAQTPPQTGTYMTAPSGRTYIRRGEVGSGRVTWLDDMKPEDQVTLITLGRFCRDLGFDTSLLDQWYTKKLSQELTEKKALIEAPVIGAEFDGKAKAMT